MNKISVKLKDAPHNILTGRNCLKDIGKHLKKLNIGNSVFIITNHKVGGLYEKALLKSLRSNGFTDTKTYYLSDGERFKNTKKWEDASKRLAAFDDSKSKKSFIINLGGGVVGDLGGFVAAAYHRGALSYIQVPTTLLACVDCGVGGKVGVNLGKFKNSIGAIYQPKLVFADLDLLKTLNTRQFKSGFAEVIKYGVSLDPKLFKYIEENHGAILNGDINKILKISDICYRLKAGLVEKDQHDVKDIRVVLNYGHTIGHAIESASKYAYTHGESISIGMVCANDIAVKLKLLKKDTALRVEKMLNLVKLPTRIKNCKLSDILSSMANDKKFVKGKNKFVLLTGLGKTTIREGIPNNIIHSVISNRMY